jgi:hypothetical protein
MKMNMFNQSKYTRWYFSIVENAKSKTYDDYTEIHHIIPKSLDGSNESDNLITLSYREHFILHMLLPKMIDDFEQKRKMNYALSMMRRRINQTEVNSKYFDVIKKSLKEASLGRKLKEETKEKLRVIHQNQLNDEEYLSKWKDGIAKRPKPTKEQTQRKIDSHKKSIAEKYGVVNVSQIPEVKEKIREKLKQRVFSDEHKQRISESKKKNLFPKGNPMENEIFRKKISESRTGLKTLIKDGKRKLAKPNSEKWSKLISSGWMPKEN